MTEGKARFTHALVVDLEATCCNRGTLTKDDIEIIEIGAFLIDLKSLQICAELHQYVHPIKSSQLTPFCQRLTGITQENVDAAPYFPEIVEKLSALVIQYPQTIFCCWSSFDWRQFHQDCRHHDIDSPFHQEYWDLQRIFRRKQKHKQLYSVKAALEKVALNFEGREHSAYYDALNTAKLLPFCL